MPALSPTMTQGNIGAWKKQVGDSVQPGDVLVEIETDKAQMEFECQEDGYLAKIILPEGTKEAAVGVPLAILVSKKEDVEKFKDYVPEESAAAEGPKVEEVKTVPVVETAPPTIAPAASESIPMSKPTVQVPNNSGRVFASPLAKAVGKEMGIDLSGIAGSGPNGRILKADVVSNAQSFVQRSAGVSPYQDVPISNIRKVIAQRLSESKQTIPHYYLTVDVAMDRVNEIREKFNRFGEGKFKLSINDFIIKASARAMSDVPAVNSAWYGSFIREYKTVDICVAVATDSGLITPIIKDADLKGLQAISSEVRELAAKARENKLKPEQFQGGSFTISNLGMFGIKHFTAIINPPQSCILAVGGLQKRLILDPTGKPTEESFMTVTMSCDHRVVDGAVGAQWLQHFKKYLEDPVAMLI